VSEQLSEQMSETVQEQASEPVLDQVSERELVSGQALVPALRAADRSAFAKRLPGHCCQFRKCWRNSPCTIPQRKCQLPFSSWLSNAPLHSVVVLNNHMFP